MIVREKNHQIWWLEINKSTGFSCKIFLVLGKILPPSLVRHWYTKTLSSNISRKTTKNYLFQASQSPPSASSARLLPRRLNELKDSKVLYKRLSKLCKICRDNSRSRDPTGQVAARVRTIRGILTSPHPATKDLPDLTVAVPISTCSMDQDLEVQMEDPEDQITNRGPDRTTIIRDLMRLTVLQATPAGPMQTSRESAVVVLDQRPLFVRL